MASLKDLRLRINSVKSTRKITSAMKMVAASKLRRAQSAAESARPYSTRMERMLEALTAGMANLQGSHALLSGTGKSDVHLLVILTSDRGLCGGFNGTVVRATRIAIRTLENAGKTVKLMTVGRKGRDQLRREFGRQFVESIEGIGRRGVNYAEAELISEKILTLFNEGSFDVCSVIYNRFKTVIAQELTQKQLVPLLVSHEGKDGADHAARAIYEFEPSEEAILNDLLPRNLAVQVFRALLESAASEQGSRMTAMDNATRNAGDMINKLTITYNRSRQAQITKELIEIISGAEAL